MNRWNRGINTIINEKEEFASSDFSTTPALFFPNGFILFPEGVRRTWGFRLLAIIKLYFQRL